MKKNIFLLLLCFGISLALAGCRRRSEIVVVEENRVSGPLSDCDVAWCDDDYK